MPSTSWGPTWSCFPKAGPLSLPVSAPVSLRATQGRTGSPLMPAAAGESRDGLTDCHPVPAGAPRTAARLPAFADGACPFPALPVHRAQRWAGSWAWSPCSEGAVGFRWEGFVGLHVGLVPGFHCSGLSPCFLCRWGTSIGWPEEACALSSLCTAPRLGSGPHPSPQGVTTLRCFPPAELSLCLLSLSFVCSGVLCLQLVRNSIVTQCPLCWQVLSLAPR